RFRSIKEVLARRRWASTTYSCSRAISPGRISRRWGNFDFIIAHGVFSWVPAEVQEALLSTFRRLLAPEGVAYMSYNVYPGWKAKEIVRDAMLLASGDSVTPEEKVREARRPGRTPWVSGIPTSCTTNSR